MNVAPSLRLEARPRRAESLGIAELERKRMRRQAIAVTAALWLFHSLMSLAAGALMDMMSVRIVLARFGAGAAGFLLCLLIYLALERMRSRPFWEQLVLTCLSGIPAGIVYLFVERYGLAILSSGRLAPRLPELTPFLYYNRVLFWSFFFICWAFAVQALFHSVKAAEEQRKAAQAQMLAQQAQLRALRYQLNPHFLFNTLNSIAALVVDGKTAPAELMLKRLSSFLRGGLAADPYDEIELRTEIAQQLLYLEIERVRFPERLAVEVDVPSELDDALVPALILQPLVENAVKYAVAPSADLTTIAIAASHDGDRLRLVVRDDGHGRTPTSAGTGIGLANVRQRLEARFGEEGALESGPLPTGGFAATLTLPLRRAG